MEDGRMDGGGFTQQFEVLVFKIGGFLLGEGCELGECAYGIRGRRGRSHRHYGEGAHVGHGGRKSDGQTGTAQAPFLSLRMSEHSTGTRWLQIFETPAYVTARRLEPVCGPSILPPVYFHILVLFVQVYA